jgi:hypothetical protein
MVFHLRARNTHLTIRRKACQRGFPRTPGVPADGDREFADLRGSAVVAWWAASRQKFLDVGRVLVRTRDAFDVGYTRC